MITRSELCDYILETLGPTDEYGNWTSDNLRKPHRNMLACFYWMLNGEVDPVNSLCISEYNRGDLKNIPERIIEAALYYGVAYHDEPEEVDE